MGVSKLDLEAGAGEAGELGQLDNRLCAVHDLYMAQLNVNLDPATENNLGRLMRLRAIRTKSEAVRVALAEAVERATRSGAAAKYSEWLWIGNRVPVNSRVRFTSEDDLWGSS